MQIEAHAVAEQACGCPSQKAIIRDAADHIVFLHRRDGVLPYCRSPGPFGGMIHSWGFSSVAAGMLEASLVVPDRRDAYHAVARQVVSWLLEHAWTGTHFIPVLKPNGEPHIAEFFPRSDGWTIYRNLSF